MSVSAPLFVKPRIEVADISMDCFVTLGISSTRLMHLRKKKIPVEIQLTSVVFENTRSLNENLRLVRS